MDLGAKEGLRSGQVTEDGIPTAENRKKQRHRDSLEHLLTGTMDPEDVDRM